MKAGDSFRVETSTAIELLCARCKQPVQTGETHECPIKEREHESTTKEATEAE